MSTTENERLSMFFHHFVAFGDPQSTDMHGMTKWKPDLPAEAFLEDISRSCGRARVYSSWPQPTTGKTSKADRNKKKT
jgi:hypothetical protein